MPDSSIKRKPTASRRGNQRLDLDVRRDFLRLLLSDCALALLLLLFFAVDLLFFEGCLGISGRVASQDVGLRIL